MISRRIFLVPFVALALVSCGLKGPLYLPESDQTPSAAQDDEDKRKERTHASRSQAPAAPTDTSSATPQPETQP